MASDEYPKIVCLLSGGPEFDIQVGGKQYHFEWHPYCGPCVVGKNGSPKYSPNKFLDATTLWDQQGRKVENGLCVWYREPKPILKHLTGKHYQIVGYDQPVRGE